MKRLEFYKQFLEYLSSKENPVSYKAIMKKFKLNKKQLENLFSHMDKYYDNAGHIKGKEHDWYSHLVKINHQGVEYLRNIEMQEISQKQSQFNKIIALTGCIIAFITAWNYLRDSYFGYIKNIEGVEFLGIGLVIVFFLLMILGKETIKVLHWNK